MIYDELSDIYDETFFALSGKGCELNKLNAWPNVPDV